MCKPKTFLIHGDQATEEMCTVFTKWRNNIEQNHVCMNNQYNNSHHKMHKFVPLYNQRNNTILGSADIGIHFYGENKHILQ